MNVCILGAGASGLAAIRHVSESQMTGVVFESTEDIGGIWNYTDDTGEAIHSTAYKGLRYLRNYQLFRYCLNSFDIIIK